jgi:membrane fusion protein (multidrug efflux system)
MTKVKKIMTNRHGGWISTLLVGVVACGGDVEAGGARDVGVLVEGASRVINVEIETVEVRDFVERINLTGTVIADQDVTLSAQESGVIRQILVEQGAAVTVGQPLLEIDDAVLRSQVEEAAAQASLASETWTRRKRLYEEDQVGSELAYLEARYGAEQAAARLTTLETRLGRTVVRAPIDGVLETRMVEVGAMVNVGTSVARIVSLDPVKVVAGVPERYARDVIVGSSAATVFDALDISTLGKVSYVGATVNPRNRTFLIEIEMRNPGRVIKPEMVANVGVVLQTIPGAIVIRQEALVRVEDGYVAFVVEGNGDAAVVVSREVELGSSQQNEVVVEAGLSSGERLIVVGQQQVTAGDRVNIVGMR